MPPGILKTTQADLRGAGHFVSGDCDPNINNDHIVIAANSGALVAGTVLGKVTATGQYTAHDPAAVDGSEAAAALLWDDREDSTSTQRAAAVTRGPIAINGNSLTFADGISTVNRDAAVAALAALGIMVRF